MKGSARSEVAEVAQPGGKTTVGKLAASKPAAAKVPAAGTPAAGTPAPAKSAPAKPAQAKPAQAKPAPGGAAVIAPVATKTVQKAASTGASPVEPAVIEADPIATDTAGSPGKTAMVQQTTPAEASPGAKPTAPSRPASETPAPATAASAVAAPAKPVSMAPPPTAVAESDAAPEVISARSAAASTPLPPADLAVIGGAPALAVEERAAVPREAPLPEHEVAAEPPPSAAEVRQMAHMGMNGRPPVISRNSGKDEIFAEGDHVVYPTHGVGRVEKIAREEIAGHQLELIHVTFEENRMTLRVPVAKARTAGLRKLATRKLFDEALAVLRGRARVKRTMWSRRAQEYEAKINSGDPLAIAEVVRDLHRNAGQPDQSFSERQIYEAAMDRLAAELGALDQTDKNTAATKLAEFLKAVA